MWYVYELYDEEGVKYIGKGTGQRMYQHERDTISKLKHNATHRTKKPLSRKEQWIANRLRDGLDIGKRIVYQTEDEQDAYHEEMRRIKAAPYLLNVVGRVPRQYGPSRKKYRWEKGYR